MIKIKKYSDVPGWGDFNYVYELLIKTLPEDAKILEIGVGFGRGTWTFLNYLNSDMSLYVLDSFKRNSNELWEHARENGSFLTLPKKDIKKVNLLSRILSQKDFFLLFIKKHKNQHKIKKIYDISSQEYIDKQYPNNYDLVFIDGCHEYQSVKNELEYFKNCNLLVGHDYLNHDCPGVKQAVTEFLSSNTEKKFFLYKKYDVYVISNSVFSPRLSGRTLDSESGKLGSNPRG